jgi:hypothetical protein
MANLKKILWDGHALSEFSNLEPDGVRHFQQKYPDFVPHKWWTCHPVGPKEWGLEEQWRFNQGMLREAWGPNGFSRNLRFVMEIMQSVFNPDDMTDVLVSDGHLHSRYSIPGTASKEYPYQRAVVFLFEHPWRARFCPVCKKRFVAAEAKTKFCSQQCSDESTRRRHLEWARKNLKAWRKKQKPKMKSRGGK